MSEIFIPNVMTDINGHDQSMSLLNYHFLKKRKIRLTGEINDVIATSIAEQIEYLSALSDDDIYLYINSPGGSVSAGMEILDAMNASRCDICTIAAGRAYSMGSFLLASGAKGKRFAQPNSEIMIHQPLGGVQGQATDIVRASQRIQKTKIKLAEILAKATGKHSKTLLQDMERDKWMSASEAKDYGLVDQVGFPEY